MRLPKPDSLAGFHHPWHLKAGTVNYLAGRSFGGFLWTDADTLFVRDGEDKIAAAVARMCKDGLAFAATPATGIINSRWRAIVAGFDSAEPATPGNIFPEGLSLGEFYDLAGRRGLDVSSYEELLDRYGICRDRPMISIGFLICLDPGFARRWRDLALRQKVWVCFEQACFTILAYAENLSSLKLDLTEWNVHGHWLETIPIPRADSGPRHLHIGSIGARHISGPIRFYHHKKEIAGDLKVFARQELRDLFFRYLEAAIDRHREALERSGVLLILIFCFFLPAV